MPLMNIQWRRTERVDRHDGWLRWSIQVWSNFVFVANAKSSYGVLITHIFAVTAHFKGCYDGLGGNLKHYTFFNIKTGKWVVFSAEIWFTYLRDEWLPDKNTITEEDFLSNDWTKDRVFRYHLHYVSAVDVDRGERVS